MAVAGFREYVEAVRSAADIADVVGDTVSLRKAGHSLVGLCPFHQEKTPSFRVDREKGLYYCFGCQAGGDVFSFVKALHGVEFPDAVKIIGDRYGIPRPARGPGRADARRAERARRLADLITAAFEFYKSRLSSPDGEAARRYLASRGFDRGKIESFGLGYAPAGWDGLLRHLSARGYTVDEIVRSGLAVPRKSGDGAYDRFRDRVVFPIRDSAGRVVSFGGRALGDDEPKYLNGPETEVYDKGRVLFRLSDEAAGIRTSGRVVVVEGYFDALALAASGVPGAVAVCGTALGSGHARVLRRFARKVVLMFDGDRAGRRAARRALGPLLDAGLAVRVAAPQPGRDPDDIAREDGAAALAALVEGALDLPAFLVTEAQDEFDLSALDGRVAALEMILAHLVHLESELARADAISRIADALGVEDDLVRDELRRAARGRRTSLSRETASRTGARRDTNLKPAERGLLRFLFERCAEFPEAADALAAEIDASELSPVAASLVTSFLDARASGRLPDFAHVSESLDPDTRSALLSLTVSDEPPPDETRARGCLQALTEKRLAVRLAAVQRKIESSRDPEEVTRLLGEKLALARRIADLRVGTADGARG